MFIWTAGGWDEALAEAQHPAPLLQSWAWGEVQGRSGWRVARVVLPGPVPATVLLRGRAPLTWGYVPRGPARANRETLLALAAWAEGKGLTHLRVEPEGPPEIAARLDALGFRQVRQVQPPRTLIVPLGEEADMLAAFKPRTRYNVRLALRRGLRVDEGAEATVLGHQLAASAQRKHIRLPGASYLELLLTHLPWCRTYVVRLDGLVLAATLVAHHDGRAYYLFSGAAGCRRELKPVYAAQWAAMRSAAAAGCADYDLWGLPPSRDPAHPWFGFGEFKLGFGGHPVEYPGTWDLVLSESRYRLVEAHEWAVRRARRLRSATRGRTARALI